MEITGIRVYRTGLPLKEGRYAWAGGNYVEVFDATVVEVETDFGVVGCGESTPLGPAYLPAFAGGVRAGLAELAPRLLGADPTALGALNRRMDTLLKGHPYVKSAIDMACWDILGQVASMPVHKLLGGRSQEGLRLYRAISQQDPAAMAERIAGYREEGYTKFQLKVGGDPGLDIERIRQCRAMLRHGELLVADANCGWTQHEAVRVAAAVKDLDIYLEQPCRTYEECLAVRRRTALPFILDEVIDSVPALLRAIHDQACDAVNLKIAKVGGLTAARLMRDLAAAAGLAMTIEDTWGGDIVTAAIAHLAQSTPPHLLLSTTDFNSYGTREIATGAPKRCNGVMSASDAPGLGCKPIAEALGEPVAVYS